MNQLLRLTLLAFAFVTSLSAKESEIGFISLFDGKTLEGWKVNENDESFSIEDGAIKANGKRSHLFYNGKVKRAKFKNFELRLDVMARENSNGGVFIHTEFLDSGWPSGYEIQVNNTQSDVQKSGGLYNTVRNLEPFEDNTWMKYVIIVQGDTIKVSVNDKELVNYTEEKGKGKLLKSGGTIAFQSHDPGSTTYYKNIRIKPLP